MEEVKYSNFGKTLEHCPQSFQGRFVIPYGVTEIGKDAFRCCSGLTSVEIPDSVKIIGDGAFYQCRRLTSIEIPNSVTDIGAAAFKGCTMLTSIAIPNSVMVIGYWAFRNCTGLTSIEIPDSVIVIGDNAFDSCTGLTSVEIPYSDEVISIGSYAFANCIRLTSIEIPNSVRVIEEGTFKDCTGLTSVRIPNDVIEIGEYAFQNCSNLTWVNIANGYCTGEFDQYKYGLSKIGCGAFDGCKALLDIKLPVTIESIDAYAFSNINPQMGIHVDEYNDNYCSIEGSLYSKNMQQLYHCCEKGIKEFITPKSVKQINSCAFNHSRLERIVLQEGVEEINIGAFSESSISYIKIPSTIKRIDDAFFDCKLKELHIRKNNPRDINVDDEVFWNCAENCVLYVPIGTGYAYRHHPVFGKFKEVVIEN